MILYGTYNSIDSASRIALTYKKFLRKFITAPQQRSPCLPGGVYRMEKYARGNSINGRGRIRARRYAVKAVPDKRGCRMHAF